MALTVANIAALCGCYFMWDVCAWWREKYQAGSFRSLAGVVLAHAGIIALYITLSYRVLRAFPSETG